ncbi:MAG: HAD-IA family hydrolase [Rhodobacteraceae bacterium]|nr:HAD-IA family hydrolase [Paracoccaceae bacterium]
MQPEAKALILDFGGVVSRTMFETHSLTEQALGLAAGSLTWRGPFDPESDPLWRSMQKDAISEREYWQQRTLEVSSLVGANWQEMSDFVQAARGAAPHEIIRPEFLRAAARARKNGVKLALLSNELDLFYGADFRGKLPFFKDFAVVQDATYSDILKPDPRAYQSCLSELGLPASSCVFVDDQARNVLGAKAIGLNTVHFDVTSPAESFAQALALLGIKEGVLV